jgi:beta-glucosidase
MARLTHFTADAAGAIRGVTHELFAQVGLAGGVQSSTVETAMISAGSTRREPEEQELNALTARRGATPYQVFRNSSRWTAYYTPEQDGDYTVFAQTDGRFRLLIDDQVVFDSSEVPKYILSQVTMPLTEAPHKVVLEQLSQQIGSVSGLRVGITPVATMVDPVALAIAKKSDAVILCVGFNDASESEGGDRSFELPVGQEELIQAVAALGKKTIVVLTAGGSVDLARWKDNVQAIFQTWYAGEQGGTALARLLFGEANPSGHLPISWERKITDNPSYNSYYPEPGTNQIVYREGVFVGYRGYEHTHTDPMFPFGFGLSYTTFRYSNLKIEAAQEGSFRVGFDVQNTGRRAGATVAQLYVGERAPTVERPGKELKGFERVFLEPGESRHLVLPLGPRSFSYFDVKAGAWRANPGVYNLMLGDSSQDIRLKGTLQLNQGLTVAIGE